MQRLRHGDLPDAKALGDGVGQLLQRTERAEPAAENAPSPEQKAKGDKAPQQEDDRLDQKGFPTKAGQQGMHKGHHLHHRKLAVQTPAQNEQA